MKKLLSLLCINLSLYATPVIPPKTNLECFLKKLEQNPGTIRLHLGCGQSHLPGYINIDFPSSEHTVQAICGADIFGDITQLIFNQQSIDEVRSHHVFEHFNRQHALALVAIWHHALKIGATLFIETPDFEESMQLLIDSRYSYADKQKIMRHVFGSHEAFWAYHYDGWYEEKFRHILNNMGFEIKEAKKGAYLLTRNITIIAQKTRHYSPQELRHRAHELLKEHMIIQCPDETKMWQVWCTEFDNHFLPFIS